MRPTNNIEVILKAIVDDNVSELAQIRPTNNIELLLMELANKEGGGSASANIINDSTASDTSTFSSVKINTELNKKSATSHTHTAKSLEISVEGLSSNNLEDALKEIIGMLPQGE